MHRLGTDQGRGHTRITTLNALVGPVGRLGVAHVGSRGVFQVGTVLHNPPAHLRAVWMRRAVRGDPGGISRHPTHCRGVNTQAAELARGLSIERARANSSDFETLAKIAETRQNLPLGVDMAHRPFGAPDERVEPPSTVRGRAPWVRLG